jgi:hypothetical protein
MVAPLAGLMAWVAIAIHLQTCRRIRPCCGSRSTSASRATATLRVRWGASWSPARPQGTGLFVGGNGDWIDIDCAAGFDTSHGLTLELWMRRENWVNPYTKGAGTQQVASVDLELDYKGHAEVRQVAFAMDVVLPRERVGAALPITISFVPRRARARRTSRRLGAVTIPARQWTTSPSSTTGFLVDRMRLYVDGRQVARGMPWRSAPGFAAIRTVRIGTAAERNGAYRGMVDELKLYARPLSEEEIAETRACASDPFRVGGGAPRARCRHRLRAIPA